MSKKILVTGGGGFLGLAVCKELQKRNYQVLSFSRGKYPALEQIGVKSIQGDLSKIADVSAAMKGCDGVIHCAALAGFWGKEEDYYRTNVDGTRNILDTMIQLGIKNLVYTSTPSVVISGLEDICGEDETFPYPKEYFSSYGRTKRQAEELVFSYVQKGAVRAVALRPHLIWGPGDPHFLPRLIERSKQGRLMQIGEGKNLVDIIFVDNAAMAHVDALEALEKPNSPVIGKAYFLGQEKPVPIWDFLNRQLRACGAPTVTKKMPFSLAYGLGAMLEKIYLFLGWHHREPHMTRFIATMMARSHYFSHKAAHRDFGYHPKISIEEGLERLKAARPT